METHYITFGSEGQIYEGGWVEVEAESHQGAFKKFIAHFGEEAKNKDGFLRCCSVYNEKEMRATSMLAEGNLGYYCHERF